MKLIFLDESGSSKNWLADIDEQPFYVLAAIIIDSGVYIDSCQQLRNEFSLIDELEQRYPLGQGFELKANTISSGKGWWKNHTPQRNKVRELMLSFPKTGNIAAFLVVIDKRALNLKYASPHPPDTIAFKYMFERLQLYLTDQSDIGLCIYDQTKVGDDKMHENSMSFMRDGSNVEYSQSDSRVSKKIPINRIKEFYLGKSDNSIGLQVADYFAHFGYRYYKMGKPDNCGWWATLEEGLYCNRDGKPNGYGLKVFP